MIRRYLGYACLLLVFCGCSQTPPLDVDRQQQAALQAVQRWQAEGKLGLRMRNEANSAYFDWHHGPDEYALRLSGPFGAGTTWLRQQNGRVSLESADHPRTYAGNAEDLMQAQLGWQVPVSNLSYWIKGVPAPGEALEDISYNPDGTLAHLEQQGWQIRYSNYRSQDGWALPGKLVAKRGDLTLTLVIKSWDLAQAATAARL